MPSRRTVVTTVGATLSAPLGGCSQSASGELSPPFEAVTEPGAGQPVSLEVEPTREYTYVPEDDAVRYETTGPERVTHAKRMPFEEWGTRRANEHAYQRLNSRLDEEFPDRQLVRTAMGHLPVWELTSGKNSAERSDLEFKRAVEIGLKVLYYHVYDHNGDRVETPHVSWDALVNSVPRAIELTMLFPEREYTAILPVLCEQELHTLDREEKPSTYGL